MMSICSELSDCSVPVAARRCGARHSLVNLRARAGAPRRPCRRPRRCAPPARGGPRPRRERVADALDAVEQPHRLDKPGTWPGGRSIWLGSPVTIMREFSPRRVRNIFICIDVVFCASSRITTALASVRPRMKASGAISISPVCMARSTMRRVHQVVERVVDRAQIGIDLLPHVAGQEAEPLAGLDGRPRQDDALDLPCARAATPRGRRRARSCRCRPGRCRTRARACAAPGYRRPARRCGRAPARLRGRSARSRPSPSAPASTVEQRALRDRHPDRAVDVAGRERRAPRLSCS